MHVEIAPMQTLNTQKNKSGVNMQKVHPPHQHSFVCGGYCGCRWNLPVLAIVSHMALPLGLGLGMRVCFHTWCAGVRRCFIIRRRVEIHQVVRGLGGMHALHGSCRGRSRIHHFGYGLDDFAADGVDETVFHVLVDVHEEVGSGWIVVLVVFEDLVQVLYFGHILVIVLAPDILLEVVDVDVVVAERDGAMVHEDGIQSVREVAVVGELAGYHGLGVFDLLLDGYNESALPLF